MVVVVVVVGLRDLDRTNSDRPACVVLDLNGFLVVSVCSVVVLVVVVVGRRLFKGLYLCVDVSDTCSDTSSEVGVDSVIGLLVVVNLCLGLNLGRSLGFSLDSMVFCVLVISTGV